MKIISLPGCVYCRKAKELLINNNIQYTEQVIGLDITRDEVINLYPDRKELPIILEDDGKMIGGYLDLLKLVETNVSKKMENEI